MDATRDEAGAHLLLNGWTGFYYLTPFEHADGWAMWHEVHHAFRTSNARLVLRTEALPEGAKDVVMGDIPASMFWSLYNRIERLRLVERLGNRPNPDDGQEDGWIQT